nr:MAG TPA: Cyclic nucleotide-gated cation channel protein [Caudoviricetes sp.]
MEKIDQTRFARGLGYKFYHSFEEHQQKAKRRITDLGTKE